MKGMGVLLGVALMVAAILSGCLVVPADGWHEGWRDREWHHRDWDHRRW